jgi:hypothetical protein
MTPQQRRRAASRRKTQEMGQGTGLGAPDPTGTVTSGSGGGGGPYMSPRDAYTLTAHAQYGEGGRPPTAIDRVQNLLTDYVYPVTGEIRSLQIFGPQHLIHNEYERIYGSRSPVHGAAGSAAKRGEAKQFQNTFAPPGTPSLPGNTRKLKNPLFATAAVANKSFAQGLKNLAVGKKLNAKQQIIVGAAYAKATQTEAGRAEVRRALLGDMTDDRYATPAQKAMIKQLARAAQTSKLVASGNRIVVKNLNNGKVVVIKKSQAAAYDQRATVVAAAKRVAGLTSIQTAKVLANAVARRQSGQPLSPQQITALRASTAAQRARAR